MTTNRAHRTLSLATIVTALSAVALLGTSPARAQSLPANVRPESLRDVEIQQRLDNQVPGDLRFIDARGAAVRLGSFYGHRPLILALVYHRCPMLCTQVLNGLLNAVRDVPFDAGNDFTILAVSIDPLDTPAMAQSKQAIYAGLYGRPGTNAGWQFLTGAEPEIAELARSVGFRYTYDPRSGQFAHASTLIVLTPSGKVSRYLYGISFRPRDLRLALVDASAGKIGSITDELLLYCYAYDPESGKYGLIIWRTLRGVAVATVLALGIMIVALSRRSSSRTREPSQGSGR
jgi:protein SCO1/2